MSTPPSKLAPAFKAPSSIGREISLADYRGKYVVLYFYPKSFTAGCTIETIAFQDASEKIRSLNAEVLGVSCDAVDTQCKFAGKHGASFPILADVDCSITRSYGVLFPIIDRGMRVTFVIDPEGYIVARFHHELMFKKHVTDAIEFLESRR